MVLRFRVPYFCIAANFFLLPVTFQSQVLVSSSPGGVVRVEKVNIQLVLESTSHYALPRSTEHIKPAGRCSREEDLKKVILIQSSLTSSILSLQFFYNKGIERKIY
jgi:hypothetical protein